jgi:hypothetical protein
MKLCNTAHRTANCGYEQATVFLRNGGTRAPQGTIDSRETNRTGDICHHMSSC